MFLEKRELFELPENILGKYPKSSVRPYVKFLILYSESHRI